MGRKVVRLYHGTNLASAFHLRDQGLDETAARQYNGGGEFWATDDPEMAKVFAYANPASPPAALFVIEVPEFVWLALLGTQPRIVIKHRTSFVAYEFLPLSFNLVNANLASRSIVRLP